MRCKGEDSPKVSRKIHLRIEKLGNICKEAALYKTPPLHSGKFKPFYVMGYWKIRLKRSTKRSNYGGTPILWELFEEFFLSDLLSYTVRREEDQRQKSRTNFSIHQSEPGGLI